MLGLVLEGGGTKGSYQIGVYEALLDEGIEIDGIAGTSIGALNGALLLQGDYMKAKYLWENLDFSMVVKADESEIKRLENLKVGLKDMSFLGIKIKDIIKDRGFDITPLKEMLNEYIDEEKIRNSGKDLGIVTVNVSNMESVEIFIEEIPEGDLKKYLLASSYLPIFKSEKMDGSFYLDGAFHDNLPFSMLKGKGYNKFILVRIFGTGLVKKIDMPEEDYIIIQPSEDLGSFFEFDPVRSRYNMKLGYYDALKQLRDLKGDKYYLESIYEEDYYFYFFADISYEDVMQIGKILNIYNKNKNRLLFEEIIPKLALYLDLGNSYNYEDVFIKILEIRAENLKIERFQIYELEEFIKLVSEKIIDHRLDSNGIIEKIKEKVELIPILNKEDTVLRISNIIFKKE